MKCRCGGTYKQDVVWQSRMICIKCGDYYDKSEKEAENEKKRINSY